ncbi:ABC transporter substrate-binding protein, partial [Chloroflexota bacterium]
KVTLTKLDGTKVERVEEKPKYGGELTVARSTSIDYWDPGYARQSSTDPHTSVGFVGLVEGDWTRGPAGTGEVGWTFSGFDQTRFMTGIMAESWEIIEPDTVIYHMRQGFNFTLNPALEASRLAGGREITADDIVWEMRRISNIGEEPMPLASLHLSARLATPIEIYAPDKWTVVAKFRLGNLPLGVQYFGPRTYPYPPEVVAKYGDLNDWKTVISTGPYILMDYVPMSSLTWVKNPDYPQMDPYFPENQLPYFDSFKMLIMPDASTRLAAMRTGRIDVDQTGYTYDDASALMATSPEVQSSKYMSTSVIYLGGREDLPELPFDDINVRRALNMAIDGKEIVDTYFSGEAEEFCPIVPRVPEWSDIHTTLEELGPAPDGFDTQKIFGYYPEEAKQMLADAGYPDGFKTSVVLVQPNVDMASIIAAYWEKINVDLELIVVDSGVHNSMARAHSYDEMLMRSFGNLGRVWGMQFTSPGHFINAAVVNEPEVLERYAMVTSLHAGSPEWNKVVKENAVWQLHRSDHYFTPQPYMWVFWQPWVKRFYGEKNVGPMHDFSWVKYAWVDQDLKKAMGR